MKDEHLPNRKVRRWSHTPPSWIGADSVFFITINCQPRGQNQLTAGDTPAAILTSIRHLVAERIWWPDLVLLMPDHLLMLVSFSFEKEPSPAPIIEKWKRFLARTAGIKWQRDFFDHRIRNTADHEDKRNYILRNPQRAGFIGENGAWPFVWTLECWRDVGTR